MNLPQRAVLAGALALAATLAVWPPWQMTAAELQPAGNYTYTGGPTARFPLFAPPRSDLWQVGDGPSLIHRYRFTIDLPRLLVEWLAVGAAAGACFVILHR